MKALSSAARRLRGIRIVARRPRRWGNCWAIRSRLRMDPSRSVAMVNTINITGIPIETFAEMMQLAHPPTPGTVRTCSTACKI